MKKLIFATIMLVSVFYFAHAGKNVVNRTAYTVLRDDDGRDIPA